MTSLLGAKKRADEFAAAVEGQAAEGTHVPDLAELMKVVTGLREMEQPQPRPDFTADLRARLMTEAEGVLVEDATLRLPPRRPARERRLAVAASTVVLVGGSAGLAAAAQNALPGDALYPIKRGLESAEARLAGSQADQGKELLEQARSRLTELSGLVAGDGDLTRVPATVDAFSQQAVQGSDLLIRSFDENADPALIEDVRSFTAASLTELRTLAGAAPAEAQDELADAAALVIRIDDQARAACPSCASDLPQLDLPDLFLPAGENGTPLDGSQGSSARDDGTGDSGSGADGAGGGGGTGQDSGPVQVDPGEQAGVLGDLAESVNDVLGGTRTSGPGGVATKGPSGGTGSTGGATSGTEESVTGSTKEKAEDLVPEELDPLLDDLAP